MLSDVFLTLSTWCFRAKQLQKNSDKNKQKKLNSATSSYCEQHSDAAAVIDNNLTSVFIRHVPKFCFIHLEFGFKSLRQLLFTSLICL